MHDVSMQDWWKRVGRPCSLCSPRFLTAWTRGTYIAWQGLAFQGIRTNTSVIRDPRHTDRHFALKKYMACPSRVCLSCSILLQCVHTSSICAESESLIQDNLPKRWKFCRVHTTSLCLRGAVLRQTLPTNPVQQCLITAFLSLLACGNNLKLSGIHVALTIPEVALELFCFWRAIAERN